MYNFINEATSVDIIQECVYDTAIGYEADFSVNGNTSGWDQYSGIHTYGVWNSFLFGTFYGTSGRIGRSNVFIPVPAETHYTVKISMKIKPGSDSIPTTGRVMWKTLSYPAWSSDKTYDFTIYPDNVWHTYILNMGLAQWWQGSINDLRIYPMIDGKDGDEFFIRAIKITSVATFSCNNQTCSYYNNYSHPCTGVGSKAYCRARATESNYFNIRSGVNDELNVNINGYGEEVITLTSGINISGDELANDISKKISQVDIGGYAEVRVTYSETGALKIYSGTATNDSTIEILNSSAAETLGFFDGGSNVFTTNTGQDPADGFKSKSSFKIKSFQLLELFDDSGKSYIEFDPCIYNVEGGRRDWDKNGLGSSQYSTQPNVGSGNQQVIYAVIENGEKTIIDFNHPFNASGKIKKVYIIGSLVDEDGNIRTGCKLKIFRRKKNGQLKTIHTIDIPNRSGGKLYSKTQEYVAVDCNLWVNKGDLLGAYNIDVYVGKSYSEEADALYFQVSGNPNSEFEPGDLLGDGNAGLFFYSRSEDLQKKLIIDVDLGRRVNIENVQVKGEATSEILEYNIARCLDINWQVELFGGTHDTGYWDVWNAEWDNFNHPNIAYGISSLTDGIYGNENGEAADSYSASDINGLIPTNPNYFWVNGDEEWVGIHFHVGQYKADAYVKNFDEDPVALVLHFPLQRSKTIFKSAVYFKERRNFRDFALSYYLGPDSFIGNADNSKYMLIPEYSAITMDSLRIYDGVGEQYDDVKDYIFENPCSAKPTVADNVITNYGSFMASEILDWNVIEHEWEPVECKGFRIYTDYHLSTKINELELYCYVENEGTNIADSTSVLFSQYEEHWTNAVVITDNDQYATAFIGDTPRHFIIEIEPLSTLKLSDIVFTVDEEDIYVGEKGCEYELLLDNSKVGVTNAASKLDFKNIYNGVYDLHVDIPQDTKYEEGLVFWSKMNDVESITKPEVGPGAYYEKKDDYPLVFRENNCAINCYCYGLRNLIDGKPAYYSIDDISWFNHSTLASGVSIDFSNIPSARKTIINVPVMYRNKWWKFGFSDPTQTMNVREAKASYNNVEYDCTFYHDDGLGFEDGPVSGPAPHLNNNLITGSYYQLANNKYISFELDSQECIDQIILYHDNITYATCVLSIYISENNNVWGKYCDLDLKDGTHTFSSTFYMYFAIDLGIRYNLQIVRNYGGVDLLSGGVSYSDNNVSNVDDVVFDGTSADARWVRFNLLCGDWTDRYIRKIGIYPDININRAPSGGYNHRWDYLGSAITNYNASENLALNATVSGSSYFGKLYLGKLTDGIAGSYLNECWGSDSNNTQWVKICLNYVYEIYRVKIYHGYDDENTSYLVTDYTIEVSEDDNTYTTIFTITGNTDFIRTHDLADPVRARFVKINITGYDTEAVHFHTESDFAWFEGVVMREVEIYKYYGYQDISSEEYPIIAINMRDQFYIDGHSLVGIDSEDTSTDWSNADSNFCYSDSVFSDPHKVAFSNWGGSPYYEQWVAIKRNTATNYNDGPDYLKHTKILCTTEPNPTEYYWWWRSNVSQLSGDHLNTINTAKSLRIDYPTSSDVDDVCLIEGDTFEIDGSANWRDAFSFWWYIDNKDNLDDTYGYIYFGNSNVANYVEYRWNIGSLLPSLVSGWNNLFLRFKSADDVSYIEDNDVNAPDPRIVNNLELKTIGIKFRGKGSSITMNIDGFKIERNEFMDYSKFSQGFYMSRDDYLLCPIGDFSLKKGTIEFWMRPDYDTMGVDYFNQFKYRSLFHFSNVASDIFGSLIGFDGITIYYGNLGREIYIVNFDSPLWEIDDLMHLGFVFSNDGSSIDNDGSTIRLYFDSLLVNKYTGTWEIGDSKKYNFFVGGKNIHAVKEAFPSSSVDGVLSNYKIYNYCKTDFTDSLANYSVQQPKLTKPNELIEISKDNNLTFYSIGDIQLPLVYENVPAGGMVSVYIRSIIPNGLTGVENRTASISASWLITV